MIEALSLNPSTTKKKKKNPKYFTFEGERAKLNNKD
jgi:hypothetical protein